VKPAPFTYHRALAPLGVRAAARPATPARIPEWIETGGTR
jgi:hypothetical protein